MGPRKDFFITDNAAIDVMLPIIGASAYAVYSCMARRADTHGHCWPTQAELSSLTGLQPRQIRNILKTLTEAGMIVAGRREEGDRRGVLYILQAAASFVSPKTDSGNPLPGDSGNLEHSGNTVPVCSGNPLPVSTPAPPEIAAIWSTPTCNQDSVVRTAERADARGPTAAAETELPPRIGDGFDAEDLQAALYEYCDELPGGPWVERLRKLIALHRRQGRDVTLAALFAAAKRGRVAAKTERAGRVGHMGHFERALAEMLKAPDAAGATATRTVSAAEAASDAANAARLIEAQREYRRTRMMAQTPAAAA